MSNLKKLNNFNKNSESRRSILIASQLSHRRSSNRRALALMENIKSETYFRNLLDQRCRLINVSIVAVSLFGTGVGFTSSHRFTLTFRMINDSFVCKLASHIFHAKCLLRTCRSEKMLLEREILIKICFRVYMRSIFMLG